MRRACARLNTRKKLRETLAQSGLDNGSDALKKTLLDGLKAGDMWLLEYGADGLGAASLLSAAHNAVLGALFDHCLKEKQAENSIALFATGGYGRNVLAPCSDIDLLFVHKTNNASAQSLIKTMLHTLWNLNLKIGHAYRSPEECSLLAQSDHTVRTALLDRRLLAGDSKLAQQLTEILKQNESPDFILDKLQERDQRHTGKGQSRYRVEPDVKNGKGGLRDLQTLFWIVRHLYGGDNLQNVLRSPAFSQDEAMRFHKQARFLWAVRWHMHRLTGRANECLSFDLQPELAKRMGYTKRSALSGAERFMKRYFLAARETGTLTRILCARLEQQNRAQPRGLFGLLPPPSPRNTPQFPGFTRHAGRINLKTTLLEQNPLNMLQLFVLADKTGLDIHPDALSHIHKTIPGSLAGLRQNKQAQNLFFQILTSPRQPARTLRLMNEIGLLGCFIPEFGRIVAQTQYNMYHHFTIDEHTLLAISILNDIENGRLRTPHPLASRIFPSIIHKRALFLAMLLHDTGKGQGDQQIHGERHAHTAARRLGLPKQETELVAWLVRHHLYMNDIAQRRDLSDHKTIDRFTSCVGSMERLQLLFLITVADICAVGPGVWNEWKRHLLTTLYQKSASALSGEHYSLNEQHKQSQICKEKLVRKIKTLPDCLLHIEDAYWSAFNEKELLWQAQTLQKHAAQHTCVAARCLPDRDSTTIIVLAPDVAGLFVRLAAQIARMELLPTAARLFSCQHGQALDLFEIQTKNNKPLCQYTAEQLVKNLRKATANTAKIPTITNPGNFQTRRSSAFIVKPEILIDRDNSNKSLMIEVSGRNRPGLMLDVAQTLSRQNLSILSAHAENFGTRAHQVFYVTQLNGKIPPDKIDQTLQHNLEKILTSKQPEPPKIRAKILQRAAASDDR